MSEKENGRLVYALKNLPPNGRRLKGGLALRISQGNGMNVLGCSRVDVEPSLTEIETVITAVEEAFHPAFIFVAEKPVRREIPRLVGETAVLEIHYIWRVYWPVEGVQLAESLLGCGIGVGGERPLQGTLL